MRIVTNNSRVAEYVRQAGREFQLTAISGDVREVVFSSRDLLMSGWRLSADPLGGRRERANPFLTVILEWDMEDSPEASVISAQSRHEGLVGSGGVSGRGGEILRAEQLLEIFLRNEERLSELTERQKSDYAAIDASLTRGALESLDKK